MTDLNKMNHNYLLNKHYYIDLSHRHFGDCNKALTGARFYAGPQEILFTENSFCLKTAYPGLLIGIGNTHQTGADVNGKEEEGAEIKLGFTLDYVTGLPTIPGSTVKGIIRSAFKYHPEYVAGLLKIEPQTVKNLETAIFEEGREKVVFFDALPVEAGEDNCLFGLDNITPHPDPLLSPIPLTMLKIIPDVKFLFRFGFERWNAEVLSTDELKRVFKSIFIDLGIGAKTNVGYGVMEEAPSGSDESKFYYLTHYEGGVTSAQTQQNDTPKIVPQCKYPGCEADAGEKRDKSGYHDYCSAHRNAKLPNERKR